MKKTILLLVTSIISNISFAQDGLTAQQMADYQNNLMTEELNLSEAQQKTVGEINLRYSKQQKTLLEKQGSMFGKMGEMKKIQKNKNAELQKVLTNSQFEIYEDGVEPKIRKHMRKNMKV